MLKVTHRHPGGVTSPPCTLRAGRYQNGQPALELVIAEGPEQGEPWAVATVALPKPPPEGCCWIKDYSDNEGVARALQEAGVLGNRVGGGERSGWVTIWAYRFGPNYPAEEAVPV